MFHDKSGANRSGLVGALIKILFSNPNENEIKRKDILKRALEQLSIKYGYFWIFSPAIYNFAKGFGTCYLHLTEILESLELTINNITDEKLNSIKNHIKCVKYFDYALEALKIMSSEKEFDENEEDKELSEKELSEIESEYEEILGDEEINEEIENMSEEELEKYLAELEAELEAEAKTN